MSNDPRFLPPHGQDWLHLAGTDGHSAVIYEVDPSDGKPGTLIATRFRKQAIAEGCRIVGLHLDDASTAPTQDKTGLIVAAITAVMERQDDNELQGDGRPTLKALKAQAGFGVTKTEFDAAWPAYVDSLGVDDDSDSEV